MKGYISWHRQIMNHWLYQEKRVFSRYEAWLDIVMLANYRDTKVILGNEVISVERGSFITSELKLMDKWGWSKTKLRNFLKVLEDDNMIKKISDNKKTTIKVLNYAVYQGLENRKTNYEETSKRPREDTANNDNNLNNKNNIYTPEFNEFWNVYPKKASKQVAAKMFNELINSGENLNDIMTATMNYKKECQGKDIRFVKNAGNFLRDDQWKDYLTEPTNRDYRDKEIALQQWVMSGKDPEDFRWDMD